MGGFNPVSLAEVGVQSIFGLGGQIAANKQNQKINQQNIAAAYNMQDRANNFSREMFDKSVSEYDRRFDKESTYNSASSQRERLESAGLNPYIMMNGGSAGVGSSTPVSAPSGASGSVPSSHGVNPLKLEIQGAMRNAIETSIADETRKEKKAQATMAESDAAVREQENALRIEQLTQEIERLRKQNKGQDIKNDTDQLNYDIQSTLKGSTIETGLKQPDYMDEQITALRLANAAQDINLKWMDANLAMQFAKASEELLNTKEMRKLIKAQTHESYRKAGLLWEQTFKTIAEKNGIHLKNHELKQLIPLVVEEATLNNETISSTPAFMRPGGAWDNFNDRLSGTIGVFGDVVNIKKAVKSVVGSDTEDGGSVVTTYDGKGNVKSKKVTSSNKKRTSKRK